jgi:hypothetical protein
MRTSKPYTNATFTHRVDHDGGRHRQGRAPAEPLVCRDCRAVYTRRRWVAGTSQRARALAGAAREVLCPACQMKHEGNARGFFTLEGGFFTAHRAEIERLLRAEEGRAIEDNPTGRILTWDKSAPAKLTITTSTEHLVERLGHAVQNAYGGKMDYGFSHEDKIARGTWRRDE